MPELMEKTEPLTVLVVEVPPTKVLVAPFPVMVRSLLMVSVP